MTPESSFTPEGVQWAWDSTSIKRAATCPRKYYYEAICSWQSPRASVHLWFGGHYATALETYHTLTAAGESPASALRTVVRQALIDTWDTETGGPITFDHTSKSRETLIRTIVWYFEEFANDPFTTYRTDEGAPAVEHSFRLPVDNGIVFCGHIDRLCTDADDNIFVHDQKTTSTTLSPHYFAGFKPDNQFSMYTFAGKMIYSLPIQGVIVDAAQIAVGFTRFGRAPILFTDAELNEWYDETMDLIAKTQEYTRRMADKGEAAFPRNTTACGNYGGCAFRHICARPPEFREQFLRGDFVIGDKWEPIRAR